jgi:hypothetical protein
MFFMDLTCRINLALASNPPNLDELRKLSHLGFVNSELRSQVWPAFFGICPSQKFGPLRDKDFSTNRYYVQIEKDIVRSLAHHDVTIAYSEEERNVARRKLRLLLLTIFDKHHDLHYVQGFHDICTIFLLVCGESKGCVVVEGLSRYHIRESLRSSLDRVVKVLDMVIPLVGLVDPEIGKLFRSANMHSFFTLSWVLTWFSHNLVSFDKICRIFDFLLASHPLMPVYLAAAFIISRKKDLLVVECEFSAIHAFFQNIPHDVDVDKLILHCAKIFCDLPPALAFKGMFSVFPTDSPLSFPILPSVRKEAPLWAAVLLARSRARQIVLQIFRRPRLFISLFLIPMLAFLYVLLATRAQTRENLWRRGCNMSGLSTESVFV